MWTHNSEIFIMPRKNADLIIMILFFSMILKKQTLLGLEDLDVG
jgi:hypothetical protein